MPCMARLKWGCDGLAGVVVWRSRTVGSAAGSVVLRVRHDWWYLGHGKRKDPVSGPSRPDAVARLSGGGGTVDVHMVSRRRGRSESVGTGKTAAGLGIDSVSGTGNERSRVSGFQSHNAVASRTRRRSHPVTSRRWHSLDGACGVVLARGATWASGGGGLGAPVRGVCAGRCARMV